MFFVRESLRSIRRNAIPSFAAMASVLVTLLVLGVFIPVVQATTGAANEVRAKVLLDVYMKTDAKPADAARVKTLLQKTDHVKTVTFVSKKDAYERERKRNPEAYELLGSNPLPDTFRVTPDRPENIGAIRNALSPDTPSGKRTVVDPLAEDFALIATPDTIDFKLLIGLLLLSGVAVSALGSGLSLRKFLRV